MINAIKFNYHRAYIVVLGIVPVLLFIVILNVRIPYTISHFFAFYSSAYFFLLFFLYYFTFHLKGILRWLTGLSLTLLVFGLTLSFLWTSGHSDDKIIGGLVPLRDALNYYYGARLILAGQLLSVDSAQAAFRPLFSGFFSSLLWFTDNNLKWSMALLVGLLGTCCYLSAYTVSKFFGKMAATSFMVLLYFYIQPLIGYAYSETIGLTASCLAFILFLNSIKSSLFHDFLMGIFMLAIAVSARAGAFFIFPTLIILAGWIFRGAKRFAFTSAVTVGFTFIISFLIVNSLYSHIMVDPNVIQYFTFAIMLYGQVVGGAGYNSAFQQLGLRNPTLILHRSWEFFLLHPFSFVIGSAKAYRDFFLPQLGIFSVHFGGGFLSILLWALFTLLTLFGVVIAFQKRSSVVHAFALATFVGIILSIPFLPPIDGGNRFYASTMPFFFLPLVIAVEKITSKPKPIEDISKTVFVTKILSAVIVLLILPIPILINRTSRPAVFTIPACSAGQEPYAVLVNPDSYLDLDSNVNGKCGKASSVCLSDFKSNADMGDPSDNEIYKHILENAGSSPSRFFLANNLITGNAVFFQGPLSKLDIPVNTLITGCAIDQPVNKRRDIYQIQTVILP